MLRALDDAPITSRAWAWWVLASTVVACGLVAVANALVDPSAQLGTGVLDPIAAGPRDRAAKVDLLAADPIPDVVVLGSSRTKKLDPADLAGEARRPVNAAMVGADLFEARVIAAYLAERATAASAPFPQLVVGVDVEQFRDSSLQGSGLLDVPQVEQVARREAGGSDGSVAAELDRLERLLLTWQTTKASVASLRARRGGTAAPTGTGDPATESGDFNERGVPVSDAWWFGPNAAVFARRTDAKVEQGIVAYRGTYEAIGTDLDPDAREDLRALVRIARDAEGPPPLLYITPAHPKFGVAFDRPSRAARRARVNRVLRDVAQGGAATVIDCSACVNAADEHWLDAVHPSPIGARQLALRLRRSLA